MQLECSHYREDLFSIAGNGIAEEHHDSKNTLLYTKNKYDFDFSGEATLRQHGL
jgi:hypothetical protein